MSLRLVDLIVPESKRADLVAVLRDPDESSCECIDLWCLDGPEERVVVRILLQTKHSEQLLDFVTERLGDDVRIVVSSVEATLPRAEEPEKTDDHDGNGTDGDDSDENGRRDPWVFQRLSREELYADLVESARMTPNYFAMVVASALVASIGLLKNDVAVIIGAMVIAPLLGPNVALALATTLGDVKLAWTSLKVNAAGIATALVPAFAIGYFLFPGEPQGQLAARTSADFLDLAVALTAGGAGALSFTLGVPAALVGVMVAVALVPPLVVFGMAAGAAQWTAAGGAMMLTLVNLICINLAGVVTFLALGIRPASWYKAARARRAIRVAILFWFGTLAALASVIYVTK